MIQPNSVVGLILVIVLGSVSLFFFCSGVYRRYRLIKIGGKEGRFNSVPRRLAGLIPLVFGQWTLLRSVTRSDRAGITHFFIFWGGITFIPGYLFFVFGPAFTDDFALKTLGEHLSAALSFAADTLGFLALIALVWGLIRRFVVRPPRQTASMEWLYFSSTIVVLLLVYFVMEAFRVMTDDAASLLRYPVGVLLGNAMTSVVLIKDQMQAWYDALWWFEFAVISAFLIHSRYSEHMHAIAAPVNFFFKSLRPKGALNPIGMEAARGLATATIKHLTWKELLDSLTCTECGRCQMSCPAYLSGKILNPKEVIQKVKKQLIKGAPSLLNGRPDRDKAIFGNTSQSLSEEAVWDCTTCGVCQQLCPVAIEHVGLFVDLRRQLVERGTIGSDVGNALENISTLGNPWGQSQIARSDLAKQLRLPLLEQEGASEFLYWVGCAGVYDERAREVTRAVSNLLNKAGIRYAVLGAEEKCCGDPARRLGEEGLFQLRASANIEILKKYGVRRIITHCPHCYNSLKNEYRQFGANFEVVHHSELILGLIRCGRLELARAPRSRLTFHDPCYLGRYNNLYDPPRQVIRSNQEAEFVEMRFNREGSFCCGAGGGHFWMAGGSKGSRMENLRLAQAQEVGSSVIVTACPYCAVMLDTAASTMNPVRRIKVMDIAELVMEMAV